MQNGNQMFTIWLEACVLYDQYANRGIGRYGREIIKGFLNMMPIVGVKFVLISYSTKTETLQRLELDPYDPRFLNLEFISLGKPKLSTPINNLWQYYRQIIPLVSQHRPNLYFTSHFERGLPARFVPSIVPVHDAIPLATKKFSQQSWLHNVVKGWFYKWAWRKLHNASLVLSPSETAKIEVVEFGHINKDKIKVIPLGVSQIFRQAQLALTQPEQAYLLHTYQLTQKKYLIYDAGLEENKNIGKLLECFALLVQHRPDYFLIVTGGDFNGAVGLGEARNERAAKFIATAQNLGIANHIVTTGRISENLIAAMFRNAMAYINFSNYEGFGFGPLQAMASGIPPIIGNNPCFIEVSGAASLVVDPNQSAAAAQAIVQLLSNPNQQIDLKSKGWQHVQKFTWENTVKLTWEAIVTKFKLK
jgi:glycosyltransferase involved in cell wall biosynthesis